MKTNTQQVIDYLEKTSKHTFAYEDGSLFKVEKIDDKFYIIDQKSSFIAYLYSYKKVSEIDYDKTVVHYMENAKCVIKHRLFLGKNVKSIRTNKYTKEIIDSIINPKEENRPSKLAQLFGFKK